MLDLYETTLRYPNLPNVDMAFIFGDEMSAQGSYQLWPLLIPFKGDEHKSAILVPNSGHYRRVQWGGGERGPGSSDHHRRVQGWREESGQALQFNGGGG